MNHSRIACVLAASLISWDTLLTPHAFASGIVTTCDEASLRSAAAGGGLVTFACDGVITLTSTLILAEDTTLDATGRQVTLTGNHQVRVLEASPNVRLTLRHLTIAFGRAQGATGVPLQSGQPGLGGGLLLQAGSVAILNDCLFATNSALGGRGGYDPSQGRGEHGGRAGGGAIHATSASILATNCVFAGNRAVGGPGETGIPRGNGGDARGGAILAEPFHSPGLVFEHCRFLENHAVGGLAGSDGFGLAAARSGDAQGGAISTDSFLLKCASTRFESNLVSSPTPPAVRSGPGGSCQGGAIHHTIGQTDISHCVFLYNAALGGNGVRVDRPGEGSGGAIWTRNRSDIVESRFEDNLAQGGSGGTVGENGNGGALCIKEIFLLQRSLFVRNIARGGSPWKSGSLNTDSISNGLARGGAIHLDNSKVVYWTNAIVDSTFLNNAAQGAPGGVLGDGLALRGGDAQGGAIWNATLLYTTNVTYHGNAAEGGAFADSSPPFNHPSNQGGDADGGAIYSESILRLHHHTFSENAARGGSGFQNGLGRGGAIHSDPATTILANSILQHGSSGANCSATFMDAGSNLSSDMSCAFSSAGSLNNTDPILGPLDDYGGPTPTMPLIEGSPALDAAPLLSASIIDQRGRPRPFGAAADIGAFESSPPYTIRGTLSGHAPQGVPVKVGTDSVTTDASGRFKLDGLIPDVYMVQPANPQTVFVPHARSILLGPDAVDVNFHGYATNALTLERLGEMIRWTYAGPDMQPVLILQSGRLPEWSPFANGLTDPNGVLQWNELPRTNPLPRVYRTRPQ